MLDDVVAMIRTRLSKRGRPCLLLLVVALTGLVFTPAGVAGPPDSFAVRTLVTGLSLPTAFAHAPDGRIFIAEKSGKVRVFHKGKLYDFLDLRDEVNEFVDRGLLGLTLDPRFARRPRVYLLYTEELPSGEPDGRGPARGRVITVDVSRSNRYAANLETRRTLFTGFDAHGRTHSVGALAFDANGNLLVSFGDGHPYPDDPGIGLSALRALNLDSPSGKLLRISPTDGGGVPSNPYYDPNRPDSVRSKVLARGFRNPFRFEVDVATGDVYVSDVGTAVFEEIDVVHPTWSDPERDLNFGWPCYEGPERQPWFSDKEACESAFYAQESDSDRPVVDPLYAYEGKPAAAAIVGPLYRGRAYPAEYAGRLFFADFARDEISTLDDDGADRFGDGGGWRGPVDFGMAPGGTIAYLAYVDGELREIVFRGDTESATSSKRTGIVAAAVAALVLGVAVGLVMWRRRKAT